VRDITSSSRRQGDGVFLETLVFLPIALKQENEEERKRERERERASRCPSSQPNRFVRPLSHTWLNYAAVRSGALFVFLSKP